MLLPWRRDTTSRPINPQAPAHIRTWVVVAPYITRTGYELCAGFYDHWPVLLALCSEQAFKLVLHTHRTCGVVVVTPQR